MLWCVFGLCVINCYLYTLYCLFTIKNVGEEEEEDKEATEKKKVTSGEHKMAARNMGLQDPVEMSAEHNKCTHLNCTALKCTNGSMSSGTQLTCTCKVAAHQHGAAHK